MQNGVVRTASEVETNIVSVERILHYVSLPSEAPSEVPEKKPSQEWPSEGAVEFRCVANSYRVFSGLLTSAQSILVQVSSRARFGFEGHFHGRCELFVYRHSYFPDS